MKGIILLLSTLLLLSCNSGKSPEIRTKVADQPLVESSPPEIMGDTSFTEFFETFMWDQEFQKSRVVFPFKTENTTISTSGDWNHLPFYAESEYIPALSSDTLILFDKEVNTKELELSVIDFKRNTSVKYDFRKINNQWFLESFGNTSIQNVTDFEFIEFLTEFSADSIFQINHTLFPFPESYLDPENDYKTVNLTIPPEEWKHLKLLDNLNQMMVLSNMDIENRLRNIFLRGNQNGIRVKYTFEKTGGTWKLIKLEDYST